MGYGLHLVSHSEGRQNTGVRGYTELAYLYLQHIRLVKRRRGIRWSNQHAETRKIQKKTLLVLFLIFGNGSWKSRHRAGFFRRTSKKKKLRCPCQRQEATEGSTGIAPLNFYLDTRWWVVYFTPLLPCFGNGPRYPPNWRLGESGCFGEDKNLLPLPGFEPRPVQTII